MPPEKLNYNGDFVEFFATSIIHCIKKIADGRAENPNSRHRTRNDRLKAELTRLVTDPDYQIIPSLDAKILDDIHAIDPEYYTNFLHKIVDSLYPEDQSLQLSIFFFFEAMP